MTNTVAIIAAGAMGSAIARRMAENSARVLTSLKGRSQATVDRAHQAGMISASDEEIAAHAELVLSVVPPGGARFSGASTACFRTAEPQAHLHGLQRGQPEHA
jgi:3-hydroxyisobutyrate dehydrogenase-like beta-hydroxyacid dehydrogenase